MRLIKIDVPTLDKYVTRISTKKKEEIILPKQKDINLNDPEFNLVKSSQFKYYIQLET